MYLNFFKLLLLSAFSFDLPQGSQIDYCVYNCERDNLLLGVGDGIVFLGIN